MAAAAASQAIRSKRTRGCLTESAMATLRRGEDGTWTLEVEAGEDGRNADHDEAVVRARACSP